MKTRRLLFASFMLALLGIATNAKGQVSRGTITGRVTDPQEAVVPGAQVVATDTATGAQYKAVSSGAGDYTIPFLAPGNYQVSATAAGFKSFVREGIVVAANERVDVDINLAIGQQTQTVTVTAENTLLQKATAETGQVLNNEDIDNMPVNGRTPLILAQLAFGAISTGNPQFNHPFDNSGPSSFALGGGASKHNELLMDGAPDGGADGTIAFSPPMDATQQVKVETFEDDAAYGHTSGGTVDQVTKSGTNHFHGSAYEFGQYSALNDTPWFTKHAGAKKSVTRFNQYGASIGGPVLVPKVYDGHNRLFFFFAYEGIKDNTPNPSIVTVPTLAERSGDFSSLLALGSNYTLYDPASGVQNGSRVARTPISYNGEENVIPPGRLNPVGQALVSYFAKPNPNLAALPNGENNYYYPGNSTDSFDSELGRIDVNLGARDKMYYDFRHNYRYHTSGNVFNNVATGSILVQPNWGSTLDEVHIFSPNWVWENRLNWTRNTEERPLAAKVDPSTLGFPASLASASTHPGFPVTNLPGYVNFGYSKGDNIPFDSYQIFSIVNHTAGKHSVEIGADLRLYRESSFRFGNSTGLYAFGLNGGQGWTNGPYDNSSAAPIGQELASMLLGLPTSGSFDVNTSETTSAKYYALFVQDNYRILPALTLNLGLRFEHDFPTVESHNKAVNGFDFSAVSPINADAQAAFAANPVPGVDFPALQGGLTFADSSHRDMYQTKTFNFSPRVGFAWSPYKETAVRGGFGIFNDSVGRSDAIAPGFNQTTQLQASLDGYLTPYATLSNPFPDGLTTPPGSSEGLSTYLGQSVSFYPNDRVNSYSVRWNVDIQQNLPGNTLFELAYVGNHGTHLGVTKDLDHVPAQYLNVGQVRDASVINNLTAKVANPFAGLLPGTSLDGSTVQKKQLLLPYPQYSDVSISDDPIGSSYYDAMQVRLEKRMSHEVRFLLNYSWSKKIDRVSFLNPQDAAPEKRISSDDRPQHFVGSGTWMLPFGEGREFNPNIKGMTYIVSGWNLTGVYSYQPDGAPLSWGDVIYLGSNLNDLRVNPHDVNGAFDTSKFDRVSGDQPVSGDHIRTLPSQVAHARADGINSLDLSLEKSSRITERLQAQLRADFFNALNRPQFSNPNLSPTSSGFGKITSQANLPRTIQVGLRLVF